MPLIRPVIASMNQRSNFGLKFTNTLIRPITASLILVCTYLAATEHAYAQQATKHPSSEQFISPCVSYHTQDKGRVHIVKVDLRCPDVQIISTPKEQRNITTSNFAYANKTTVAINGSFYDENNYPLGLNVTDGRPWTKSQDKKAYSFLACTQRGACHIEPFNRTTVYQTQWPTVVSGWQSLVNGQYQCAPGSPRICHSNARNPHPRTAVGVSDNKHYLYMVVVEGRQENFKGYTLNQVARVFKQLGVNQAINLDGGGSSTLVLKNRRMNQLPSQQLFFERNVANHLGVIDHTAKP